MKNNHHFTSFKSFFVVVGFSFFNFTFAQESATPPIQVNEFWEKVQFGGGLGLNFSSGYTDIFLAPTAIYNLNPVVALGAGLNFNYVSSSNNFSSFVYGISTIALVNPIPQIQFSAELNQSRGNYKESFSNFSENYWSTSLILGAGYRTGNVTFGVGFNVLQNDRFDTEPFVPFVRAYF